MLLPSADPEQTSDTTSEGLDRVSTHVTGCVWPFSTARAPHVSQPPLMSLPWPAEPADAAALDEEVVLLEGGSDPHTMTQPSTPPDTRPFVIGCPRWFSPRSDSAEWDHRTQFTFPTWPTRSVSTTHVPSACGSHTTTVPPAPYARRSDQSAAPGDLKHIMRMHENVCTICTHTREFNGVAKNEMSTEHANIKINPWSQKHRQRQRPPTPPRSALSHLSQPARSAESSTRMCRGVLTPRPELLPCKSRPFSEPEGSIPSIETDPGQSILSRQRSQQHTLIAVCGWLVTHTDFRCLLSTQTCRCKQAQTHDGPTAASFIITSS